MTKAEVNPLHEVKKIDWSIGTFETKKHKYKVLTDIPLARFIEFQKRQPEFAFGMDWEKVHSIFENTLTNLNKHDYASIAHETKTASTYIVNHFDKGTHYDGTLMIAAIFTVREDEDIKHFSTDFAKKKILDWTEEGFSYSDFFTLVAALLPQFYKLFKEISVNISEEAAKLSPLQIISDIME